jgi:hypothetical protein
VHVRDDVNGADAILAALVEVEGDDEALLGRIVLADRRDDANVGIAVLEVEAAQQLKVTDRHVRRMLIRIGERGDGGIVHQLRGRPSNRKLAAPWEQKILARIRHRYADFGPTLAAEHLAKDGLLVIESSSDGP